MKRIILVILLACSLADAKVLRRGSGIASTPGTFCSGSFSICDEFTNTVDPPGNSDVPGGAGYTEFGSSTWATNGTQLLGPTSGTGGMVLLHTTTLAADQYAVVRLAAVTGDMGMLLRSNGTSGGAFEIYYNSNKLWWAESSFDGVHSGDIASCDIPTPSAGDYLIGRVVGSTTVASIWITSVMPTGAPTGTPTCTFTDSSGCAFTSPATACTCIVGSCAASGQAGTRAGIYTYEGTTRETYDNFAAGTP